MAKVFSAMFRREPSIASLLWSIPPQEVENSGAVFEQSPNRMALDEEMSGGPFSKQKGVLPESISRQYFPEGAAWAPDPPQETREIAERHTDVPVALKDLWADLQDLLMTQGYEMFHPNSMLIYARDHRISLTLMVPSGSIPLFAVVGEAIQEIKAERT
jgi:hypothetical protein